MSDSTVDSMRSQDKIRQVGANYFKYFCPGCKEEHAIPAKIGAKVDRFWQWNGSLHTPTFHPSINVNPSEPSVQCHHWVKEGKIEFCGDCYHELKGQTVDLPLVHADNQSSPT